jgi:hypothetical protein
MCVLVVYAVTNVAMDRVARWVEAEQNGYLWSSEEWMQLFGADNFADHGKPRMLLTGSSEAREGFLFDQFESELPDLEVYNNAFSNLTLQTLIVVLQYIETAYGRSALPQKIVLGVTPPFLLDQPPIDKSYLPRVIGRYSPFVSVDIESRPARLVRKRWLDSLGSRYRYLTHQSRRYKGAALGVTRWAALKVSPELAARQSTRLDLAPSRYHHRPAIDKQEQLRAMRRVLPPLRHPDAVAATVREQWAILQDFVADHGIGLYVVNMPQSTFLLDDYYALIYDEYQRLLRSLTEDTPLLDLARSLHDDEFYDVTHVDLEAARWTSKRVAQFVRDSERGHRAGAPRDPDRADVRRTKETVIPSDDHVDERYPAHVGRRG